MFAYTNAEVSALNAELRQVRRERGELASPDVTLQTKHGAAEFAVGDRVQFTDTNKKLRIYNGNAGVITGLDKLTGHVTVRLDAAAGVAGREVTWSAAEFQGFRHGYAGTIYKGQGKTLDHTYLLHTHHWRAAASYVALTRQRESAQVFVATETAKDARQLARQMGRGEVRAASVAWATAGELTPSLRPRAGAGPRGSSSAQQEPPEKERAPKRDAAADYWGQIAAPPVPDMTWMTAAQAAREIPSAGRRKQSEDGWLIAPYAGPDGRDSLGRGRSAGEVAAAVLADPAVQREREARWSYLQGAYRDPYAARAALDELVKRQGWTSAAARVAADPLQLGELRGKEGLFAGGKARTERAAARRAADAIGPSLERIGTATGRAEQDYRATVAAQRAADATGVPRLSAAAEVAIGAVATAADEKARSAAWRVVQADADVARELQDVRAAVRQRFGEEGERAMLRAAGQPGVVTAASVRPEQQAALDVAAGLTATLTAGERASRAVAQREAEADRQRQCRGLRM